MEYNNGVDEFKVFVTSSPLLLSSPTTNNEVSSTTSDRSEASTKSSSSFHNCVDDFDPEAVDFEPLIVSGTGRVLTYHSSLITDDVISIDSSVATPITRNNRDRRVSCSSYRLRQLVLIAILAAIIIERLSSLSIDTLNVTQSTEISINRILGGQNMQDVDFAYKASTSRIAVWDPFLEDIIVSANNQNLMIIVSQCFARPTFYFRKENAGSYILQETSTTVEESNQQQLPYNNNDVNHLMAIFTQNFNQVALDLFDSKNLGAFVVILHDPVAIYFERYAKGILQIQNTKNLGQYVNEYLPESTISDNLLVRYLSGINDINRTVNSDDYDIARHVLMTKFVIASCNYPVNTIRRLERMFGPSHDSFGVEECNAAKQRWNEECKNMNEVTQQRRSNDSYQGILRNLESENHFDIKLYEESKSILNEQNMLFGLN